MIKERKSLNGICKKVPATQICTICMYEKPEVEKNFTTSKGILILQLFLSIMPIGRKN